MHIYTHKNLKQNRDENIYVNSNIIIRIVYRHQTVATHISNIAG